MKKAIWIAALSLAMIILLQPLHAQKGAASIKKQYHAWWDDRHPGAPFVAPDAKRLPRLSVRGNRIVDPQGKTVLLRGLAISDPDKVEHQGHWNKAHFERVKEMGTQVVRIPVHPVAWRERTPAGYLTLLDSAVAWSTQLDMYVMIDWHSIGNLKSGLFQDPMYNTSMTETLEFWRTIARHFAGNTTVAFCELFNEPTLFSNQLGLMTWSEWKHMNEEMIAVIRAFDRETIPLVAGLDWAYDLTPLRIEPVAAQGIGYVTHPYPHKRPVKPWEPQWEEDFGFAAGTWPVIATEFGFTMPGEGLATNGEYGKAIVSYMEAKGISWVGWVFDPEWGPPLLRSWEKYDLTESGQFFKEALNAPRNTVNEAQKP